MFLHVVKAEYLEGYRVWLEFNDGVSGEIDLAKQLNGNVFEPLEDTTYFASFELRGGTLAWENGADFAPKFLKALPFKQAATKVVR